MISNPLCVDPVYKRAHAQSLLHADMFQYKTVLNHCQPATTKRSSLQVAFIYMAHGLESLLTESRYYKNGRHYLATLRELTEIRTHTLHAHTVPHAHTSIHSKQHALYKARRHWNALLKSQKAKGVIGVRRGTCYQHIEAETRWPPFSRRHF